jgi:hypothetical protein
LPCNLLACSPGGNGPFFHRRDSLTLLLDYLSIAESKWRLTHVH